MTRFIDFSKAILLAEEEQATLAFWREADVFRRSLEMRRGAPRFVFYEGPPTANGRPGIHHVLGRTIKDLVCRYQAMKGFLVERKSGWDTHGLPVELEVERKLGIQGKEQIEAYGLDQFNARCKESVFTYKDEWERITDRIAFWLDLEHPYVTLDNDYIETVWWLLSRFWEKGLVYEGFKILPYCPRCETPLSSHEVSQGYEDVEDPSVFVRFESADEPGVHYLAWTTTPWTLISNVALAVHPEEIYCRVKLGPRPAPAKAAGGGGADGHRAGDILILARARLSCLHGPHEVLAEFPGRTLHEKRYQPLFPYFAGEKDAFRVLTADYVSMNDGTGVVHTAPAFGEDDYRLGLAFGLPMPRPVNRSGEFTADITGYAGTFVKQADPAILAQLKERGQLYATGTITHSYPFCWRCDSPLIYYARDSWYLKTTAYRDRMVEVNRAVRWVPPEAGEKRFGDWLKNNVDWAISRDRYWGTPFPVWRCDGCARTDLAGGREELRKRGAVLPAGLDLHRPSIDAITFPCGQCGGTMRRVPEVVDVWFDSGAMPFAQWHYPFENQERFREMFPADFISEGVDQSRGWFYSLLAIATCVENEAPYRTVLVNDLVLDAQGQKMSKHKGNTVNPWEVLDREGADAARWYLMVNSPPWLPTRFSTEGVTEVARKFLATLRNVASFFAVYANVDEWSPAPAAGAPAAPADWTPAALDPPAADRPAIDRWLLSRLDRLVGQVDEYLAAYEVTRGARAIQEFVLDELSNWYVRRNRRRFWKGEQGPDKDAAYATLYETLRTLAGLVAPWVPFVAEEIHRKIVVPAEPGAPDSIHLTAFPRVIADRKDAVLDAGMAAVMQIVEAGRAARSQASLKVRQPLARLMVAEGGASAPAVAWAVANLADLIADELNVRAVELAPPARFHRLEVKPNFKAMGPAFGRDVNRVAEAVRGLPPDTAARLAGGETITLFVEGRDVELSPAHVEVVRHAAPGLSVTEQGGLTTALETGLTPELVQEGLVRELIHRLQNLRKERGLAVTDRIRVEYRASEKLGEAVRAWAELIRSETLALSFTETAGGGDQAVEWDVDGETFRVSIRPASS